MEGELSEGNIRGFVFDSLHPDNQETLFLLAVAIFDRDARHDSIEELLLRITPLVVHLREYQPFRAEVDGLLDNLADVTTESNPLVLFESVGECQPYQVGKRIA